MCVLLIKRYCFSILFDICRCLMVFKEKLSIWLIIDIDHWFNIFGNQRPRRTSLEIIWNFNYIMKVVLPLYDSPIYLLWHDETIVTNSWSTNKPWMTLYSKIKSFVCATNYKGFQNITHWVLQQAYILCVYYIIVHEEIPFVNQIIWCNYTN